MPGIEIVATTDSAESALNQLEELDPDLLCADLTLPGEIDGIELCRRARELLPDLRVVIYTASEDPDLPQRARDAGAVGCIAKSDDYRNLRRAIALAARGDSFTSDAYGLADEERHQGKTESFGPLTQRQTQILGLVAEGLTNVQIASRLGIGSESVKSHVREAAHRLGATDRTQAAVYALRRGLID